MSSAPECGYVFDGSACRKRGPHRCKGRVEHVVAFFSELLRHTKGDWTGVPFVPARWQRERVLAPLFGEVVYNAARGRYVRRYRVLYLCVARKNGKTELLAGMVLYLLVADNEQGAELYGLALDQDQANLVYRVAARMVRLSPALNERLTVLPSATRIADDATGSFYTTTAGDAAGSLGFDPSGAYIDELLTQPSRDLYDALRTAFGARAQPLLMLATTAENDPAGFAATEREWSLRVADDPELDPERLVVIYTADPEHDWTKPATWREANPALGDFLEERTIAAECRSAQGNPAEERAFRQFRLNQPTRRTGRAINMVTWGMAPPIERELIGLRCYAGMDLASTQDLAAYALDFPDGEGGHDVIWRHFVPEARMPELDRRTGRRASLWARAGLLVVSEGDSIDHRAIRAALLEDAARYDIAEVGYDTFGSAMLANELGEDGFLLFGVSQGFAGMNTGTTELLRLIGQKRYRHGGNPVADWEAANLVVSTDPAGHVRPNKDKSAEKIDGIVAAIMALDRVVRHGAPPPASWTGQVTVL